MDEWTIYPSINNRKRYALGSPDGRELRRGEAVEILLQQRETNLSRLKTGVLASILMERIHPPIPGADIDHSIGNRGR